jgi:hypothetical protein
VVLDTIGKNATIQAQIRSVHRLVHAVGHEDDGPALAGPERQEIVVELEARDLVERRERLVHQEKLRMGDERSRDRHAHLHAAAELARIGLLEAVEPDHLDRLSGPGT